jgi:basic membrane lipoprotein Med (substrate-binding protein (PBP1-ABC) superfamily)
MSRLAWILIVAITSAGCSGSPSADGKFKVALLSPGPVSDAGWNALAYEGLLAIRDQLGAEIAQVQTKTPAEFEAGFRDFGRRGFNLVFGHGFEFQDAAAVVPDFPPPSSSPRRATPCARTSPRCASCSKRPPTSRAC